MNNLFERISLEKQEKIINVALKEFGEYGYENASTNRIVKTLGISKGSLFKYFGDKYQMYAFLMEREVDKLLAHMKTFEFGDYESPIDGLLDYAEYEYDYLIQNPLGYFFFFSFGKELNNPELKSIIEILTSKSADIAMRLYQTLGIDNHDLSNHLNLIISAYNQSYLSHLGIDSDWLVHKEDYLKGLRKHLNFVDWRQND